MKLRITMIAGAIALVSLVTACSPLNVVNSLAPDGETEVIRDLAYGSDERQRLDLYRPTEASANMPTILFLYGGSWKRGSREDYAFAGRALAREGFLVAVADYRVYPTVRYPDFVHDAAKAVAWLTKNAQNYGGRNEGIHLMGHSAGAHIVAMVALDETYLETAGTSQAVLGPWVGLAGPYAFYPSEVRSVRDIFAAFEDDAARPIMFADSGAPPALLLHGGDDTTVYPTNSIELAERLRAFDVDASAHLYDGLGHAPIVAALTPPFDGFAPVLADSVAFLKSGTRP